MPSPSSAVVFWGVPYGSSSAIGVGNLVLPNGTGAYVVATAANQATYSRRSEGIAVTASNGSGLGSIEIWQTGTIDASISGLGAGTAGFVRCSAAGIIERFTPAPGGTSDIVGKCDTSGRVRLEFGIWTEDLALGTAGGAAAHVAGGPGDIQTRAASGGDLAAAAFWSFGPDPSLGHLVIQEDGSITGGYATILDAGGDTSALPAFGTFRASNQHADLGGLKSFTFLSYYRSSGAANVGQAVLGVSGGQVFIGDASNPLTPIQFYAPAGAGAVVFVMGSAGFVTMTGSNYSALGGAGKFLAIDNTGKVTVATPAGASSSGASGTVQLSNGSGGFSAATNVLGGTSFLSIGTAPAASGALRLTNNTAIVTKSSAAADRTMMIYDSSDVISIGTDSGVSTFANRVQIYSAQVVLGDSSANPYLDVNLTSATALTTRKPFKLSSTLGGCSALSSPYTEEVAAITQSSTADTTLSAAQYSCPQIDVSGTPGGTFNIIGPSVAGTMFTIHNGTASSMVVKKAGGVGITITAALSRFVRYNGSDYALADA